jgi:hypothetical protein
MLIRRHDVLTTIATLILLLSNLSAAGSGFRVSNVTLKQPTIRRQFGLSTNTTYPQCCAAVADINCPLRNMSVVIRSARNVAMDLTPDVLAITIFTLSLRAWTSG